MTLYDFGIKFREESTVDDEILIPSKEFSDFLLVQDDILYYLKDKKTCEEWLTSLT